MMTPVDLCRTRINTDGRCQARGEEQPEMTGQVQSFSLVYCSAVVALSIRFTVQLQRL